MQLNRFTDYGLRVLMYLHALDEDTRVTTRSIALRFDIPLNHLNKVVTRLVHLGWVSSRPGRGGGIRLAERDTPLLLGEILRELEGHPALINCQDPPCPLQGGCQLQKVLHAGRAAFYADMNRHSLDDVAATPTRALLHLLYREPVLQAGA